MTQFLLSLCSVQVVVVSNFTSMLDDVSELAALRGWAKATHQLRLDGSVAVDKRQSLVDCFNRAVDRRSLFLLSSKVRTNEAYKRVNRLGGVKAQWVSELTRRNSKGG